ncbi:MAG: hypothetical protein K2X94_05020 [Amoebophilaceae bacterium]|nr:hypothetical protein [Amoebophilaceae bacterium]
MCNLNLKKSARLAIVVVFLNIHLACGGSKSMSALAVAKQAETAQKEAYAAGLEQLKKQAKELQEKIDNADNKDAEEKKWLEQEHAKP